MYTFDYLYDHANVFSLYNDVAGSDKILLLFWLNLSLLIPPLKNYCLSPLGLQYCVMLPVWAAVQLDTVLSGSIWVYYVVSDLTLST